MSVVLRDVSFLVEWATNNESVGGPIVHLDVDGFLFIGQQFVFLH
jgi:hypothetical protein